MIRITWLATDGFHGNQVVDWTEPDFINWKASLELHHMSNYNLPGVISTEWLTGMKIKLRVFTIRNHSQRHIILFFHSLTFSAKNYILGDASETIF